MSKSPFKIMLVAGARPNFVKAAALYHAFAAAGFDQILVHTGQHYDQAMSDVFFEQLELPQPDEHLGVGSAGHGVQTGRIMAGFEPVLLARKPDAVVVVGDVNSTVACALVTAKAVYDNGYRPLLAHVEAGLRSRDRTMPEEVNRLATDHVSHLLFASEQAGVDNLVAEGVGPDRVHFVGNVMIDTLRRLEHRADAAAVLDKMGIDPDIEFGLITLHRPNNVDQPDRLGELFRVLDQAGRRLPLLMAAHPRTRRVMDQAGLTGYGPPDSDWAVRGGLALTGPLPYIDFLGLMKKARVVMTDSGGIQEETTALGVPCLTLRPNTERPATIDQGANRLVTDLDRILPALDETLARPASYYQGRTPQLWDGRAAERTAAVLKDVLAVGWKL